MSLEGQYSGFTLEIRDPGIVWICFSRPAGTYNGFTAAMKRDLIELASELQFQHDLRVIVFTGSGDAFCAGDDVKNYYDESHWDDARSRNIHTQFREDSLGLYGRLRSLSQALNQALLNLDILTISAINGVCIQSALSLALTCDFRIASDNARLGSATLRFGFMPDEGGHALLVRQIGVSRTLDFLMNQRILSADEALSWGLVNEVVDHDLLEERTMDIALNLANGPQVSMRLLKRAVYNAADLTFAQAADDIATKTAISDHSPDTAEGMAAWVERRPARFNQPPTKDDGSGGGYQPPRGNFD